MRRLVGCLLAGWCLAAPAQAQVADQCPSPRYPYNTLNSSSLEKYPVVVQKANYAIHAAAGLEDRARKVAAALDAHDVWKTFGGPGRLGEPLTGPDGRLPYFVLPMHDMSHSDPDTPAGDAYRYRAYMTMFCDRPDLAYVAIGDFFEEEVNMFDGVVVHETFHAFQGHPDADIGPYAWWWAESTATWAQNTYKLIRPSGVPKADAELFGHPERTIGDGPDLLSRYAPYRFVQYLAPQWPSSKEFYAFLRRTFDATARDPKDITANFGVLQQEAHKDGIDLQERLGAFWGAHLTDTVDNGPAATPTSMLSIGAARDSASWGLTAGTLAAGIGWMDVRSAPAGSRVTVSFPPLEKDTYVWLNAGSGTVRVRAEAKRSFCTADLRANGLRVAFTNGDQAGQKYQMQVELEEDASGCRPPRTCPAPRLGMPRRIAPHNGRMFDFTRRIQNLFQQTLRWVALQADIELGSPKGTKAARKASRARVAHWWRCGARLIERVDNPVNRRSRRRDRAQAPLDPVLRRERRALVRDMRRVAAAIEAGRPRVAVHWTVQAGLHLGTLEARRLGCEFHGHGNGGCRVPKKTPTGGDPAKDIELLVPEEAG